MHPDMLRRWRRQPMAESLFKTLTVEFGSQLRIRRQGRRALFDYIEGFYNSRPLHTGIGYHSPADLERQVGERAAA